MCKSMPVSSTKMVFLAYFGGNILNGVKLINMPMLWVLQNNIDKKNDYLPVLGGCPDHHRVRIGGFGFEGPTRNWVSVLKSAGTGSIKVLQLGGN